MLFAALILWGREVLLDRGGTEAPGDLPSVTHREPLAKWGIEPRSPQAYASAWSTGAFLNLVLLLCTLPSLLLVLKT